jgi:hypothetical protein
MVALTLIFMLAGGGEARAAGYPRDVIEAFIASCQGDQPLNAEQEAYCRCMIGALQASVPYARFAEWERRVRAGETIPEMEEQLRAASKACGR